MNRRKILSFVVLLIGSFIMVTPFLWALSVSLQGPGLAYQNPPLIFRPPYMFSNYAKVFQEANFLQYGLNSLFISAAAIVGTLLSASFAGFGFAKYDFKGSNALFFVALCTMMVPGNVMAIPLYIIWSKLGFMDTYVPLILPHFFGSAFGIFLMRQCFKGLPGALYEAAIIDGANPLMIYVRIYLPLAKPILSVLAVNTFIGTWNDLFTPLIYLTTKSKYTLALGTLYVQNVYADNMEIQMASAIIAMLPVIVVYMFAQKQFVQGLATAAVKG